MYWQGIYQILICRLSVLSLSLIHILPDKSLSISQGAIAVMGWQSCTDKGSFTRAILDALAKEYRFSLDTPFEDYPDKIKDILIHGTNGHAVKVYYKGQRGE